MAADPLSSYWPQVALVGAGPGHPEYVTLRAVECLRRADLVLYDRLVPRRLLDHAPPTAQCVCIDSLHERHAQRIPHIHQTMIDAARQGLRVVRLKGGDPFVFGRGGEEAAALRAADVSYEIVPGVTAALGAAACAGIPLTHRDYASGVAFITGHEQPDKGERALDFAGLARFPGTLVFYMGVVRLPYLVQNLIEHGKSPSTPSAAVRWATTPLQQTIEAPLGELPDAVAQADLQAPALIVVGAVAALRSELAWFEQRPLFGKHVLVTRPRHQAGDLVRRLEELGALTSLLPTVEVQPPADWSVVDRALAQLSRYQWLVFTSANGVHFFLRRLRETGRDLRALGSLRLAAIGPATAAALREYHLEPDLVPEEYRSENLAAALRDRVHGQRVLLARADRGRELLREELAAVAEIEQIAVYSQCDALAVDATVVDDLKAGRIDYVTLTSSNIARALVRSLDAAALEPLRDGRVSLVTISPVTSAAVSELGLPVAAEAHDYTTTGVIVALLEHLSAKKKEVKKG
jgi:uroporphyrinogen III methyltransferase / synthase